MSNILNHEEILCSIKAYKNISTSTTIANFIANLILWGMAGMVTNDFRLILTNKNLYIEATGYATWGGLPESRHTDKISRKDIKSFDVKMEDTEEIITITTKKDKNMIFIRNNEKNNNLALEMANLISNNKEN